MKPTPLVTAQPDATLAELRDRLRTPVVLATIWRELNQLDLTVKKTVHADEQGRADVAVQRRHWRDWLPLHDARQYMFLDECGVTTDLLRRYWKTQTVIAALRVDGVSAPAVFDGPIDTVSFRAYVEQVLVPTLRPGDVVVLGNLAVYKQPEVRTAIAAVGAQPPGGPHNP